MKNRKYLKDKICPSSSCEIIGEKMFLKNNRKIYSLASKHAFYVENKHFIHCFKKAVTEFADTYGKKNLFRSSKESRKLNGSKDQRRVLLIENDEQEEEYNEIMDKHWTVPIYGISCRCNQCYCNCVPITRFIEEKNLLLVLSFGDKIIQKYFSCHHGHCVGKNFAFLLTNVFQVYALTNLILCCNLENEPEKWGEMSRKRYFRHSLEFDHSGITFLESSRKYLADGVYMKDFNATKQLMKNCFEFIYISKILYDKVNPGKDFFDDCMDYCLIDRQSF